MAAEVTLTTSDIEKINSTEKMTKAILIIVSVAGGLMVLLALASFLRMGMMMQGGNRGMQGQRGIQPMEQRQQLKNRFQQRIQGGGAGQGEPQGQNQGSDATIDIEAL